MLKITSAKTEYTTNPIGVPYDCVRFGWTAETTAENQTQTAYQLVVKCKQDVVWDSGKIPSSDMAGITYQGKPLQPRTQYTWQVKIWSNTDECSDFSEPQTFETTLSNEEWEKADWIGGKTDGLPLLRRSFIIPNNRIARARVYVSGLGVYQFTVNGQTVSGLLNPMVTRYHDRYFYNTYDITDLLNVGENVFGVLLGNGFYCMHDNRKDWQKDHWSKAPWVDRPKLKLLAFISYMDGSNRVFITDKKWKIHESPLRIEEAYYGEEQDARMQVSGWNTVGFDDSAWANAQLVSAPLGKPVPQLAEACAAVDTLPLHLLYRKDNEYLFDTKKMTTGWVKLSVVGVRGAQVEVSYSEWLNKDGKLNQTGLLSPWNFGKKMRQPQTDYFTLSGEGEETFSPYFDYKGFRYVRIRIHGTAILQSAVAETVHANLAATGEFACSDETLNRLHEACKNSMLCNLHSYPSDTPVYEKLGYLADGYLTQDMACLNFDSAKYYEKWARDILTQIKENGYIEQTAPMWDENKENAPEWSAAVAIVPYQLYRATGDKTMLVESYEAMKKVFAYQMALTDGCIANSMWGDHVSANHNTIPQISATSALYAMAKILTKTANLQDKTDEAQIFTTQAEQIKIAFNMRFFKKNLGYYCETEEEIFTLNAQILPYALGLADEEQKQSLAKHIREKAFALEGGIFTVKLMPSVLDKLDLNDRLYAWIEETTPPSWGYWLAQGDGSLWEQWYDHTRSRNHHMFGAIDEWLYYTVAGLKPVDCQNLTIKPFFAQGIDWANARIQMPSGIASCSWNKQETGITLTVKIPFNVTAVLYLPHQIVALGSGEYTFEIK